MSNNPQSAITNRRSALGLAAILCAYLLIGALFAFRTPAWQVPDEPAHYNYIRFIAETGRLPVLQPGDYDHAYLEQLKAERFPPALPVTSIRYESWQPPLYYLLAAPVFALTRGDLIGVRLFTLALGAGVIAFTYALARTTFAPQPVLALTAAGFVAFIPQHIAMLAAANNDALAELLIAAGLWLSVSLALTPHPQLHPWALGLVLGLAFLTKLSAYPLAAVIALAVLLRWRRGAWSGQQALGAAARIYVPAVLLGALWWGRNLAVYGGFDFLAMDRHSAIVVGQLRTADAVALWGPAGFVQSFFLTTFRSFWGQFGWMGVVMDQRVYWALLAYSAGLVLGLGGAVVERLQSRRPLVRGQGDVLVLMAVAGLLTVAVYLYYNLGFVQFQGRYLFPALPILALAAAISLRQWTCWLTARLPLGPAVAAGLSAVVPLAPITFMAALDVYALYRFIIPALA